MHNNNYIRNIKINRRVLRLNKFMGFSHDREFLYLDNLFRNEEYLSRTYERIIPTIPRFFYENKRKLASDHDEVY